MTSNQPIGQHLRASGQSAWSALLRRRLSPVTRGLSGGFTACLTGGKLAQREAEARTQEYFQNLYFLSSVLNKNVLLLRASSCILARDQVTIGFRP